MKTSVTGFSQFSSCRPTRSERKPLYISDTVCTGDADVLHVNSVEMCRRDVTYSVFARNKQITVKSVTILQCQSRHSESMKYDL